MRSASIAALVCAAFATVAAAQSQPSDAPVPLTLQDAVRRGLETSHRVAEATAREDAAEASVAARRSSLLPQVNAQAGYTRTNHVDEFGILLPTGQLRIIYPDVPDNYRTRVDVQWPLYTGGRLEALERSARSEAGASTAEIESARNDLTLDITRAYWTFVTSIESLRVVEEAIVRIDAHLADVRNQFANGLVPPNDVLNIEAQASRQRMLAVQARATRDIAEADLARLTGLAPGTTIRPAGVMPVGAPQTASIGALVDAALRQRPERAALLKRVEAAEERVHAAAGGAKPAIGVGGGVDYARPNPRIFPREAAWATSWDASVNVAVPLFDGGKSRSDSAEAAAGVRALKERLADLDEAIALEVRQRVREAESTRAAIEAADAAVRSATEARRVVGERFAVGVATSTDVLDAQVALLQAELDRTNAVASAHLADARLARALGSATP